MKMIEVSEDALESIKRMAEQRELLMLEMRTALALTRNDISNHFKESFDPSILRRIEQVLDKTEEQS